MVRPMGQAAMQLCFQTANVSVADEKHAMLENDKRRRRTTLQIVLLRLRNMALEGTNVRAFEEFHRLAKAYQPQEADDHVGYLVVPAPMTARRPWISR